MSRQQPDFFRQPARLQAYLDGLTQAAGHADRVVPIENYTKGLMLPIERKSVEPMAARLAPGNRSEEHTSELQSLRHLVCRLLLEKKTTRCSLHSQGRFYSVAAGRSLARHCP